MKVDRVKRRVVGRVCSAIFLSLNSVPYLLDRMTDRVHGEGKGLLPKEIELLKAQALKIHEVGEVLRKMSHRLCT